MPIYLPAGQAGILRSIICDNLSRESGIKIIIGTRLLKQMIFKRALLVLCTTLIGSALYSQHGFRLKKNIKLDTLRIWINYPVDFEKNMVQRFDSIFESTVGRLNEDVSFNVDIDSINPTSRIIFNMESIKYVDTKRNIFSTGLSLALIGGHALMISAYGWTAPIWPILLPATVSKVMLQIDQNMINSKPKLKIWIGSNGYFIHKEKQSQKFERNFDKVIYKFIKSIDKQYVKKRKL